jgi:hypothetical protein
MARKVFFSFHFVPDCQRAAQVRNIGVIEGNAPASSNEWETAKNTPGGIERWIENSMSGRSCAIVLIGADTAGRKWINYEIEKAWRDGRGLLGIHIHNLKNLDGDTSSKGNNPFADFKIGTTPLSQVVKTYDPSGLTSKDVYGAISDGIAAWIEEAITIRGKY